MHRPRGMPFALDDDTAREFGPMKDDCRIWRWSRYRNGYGRVKYKGKGTTAHRVFYELLVGPVPEGLQLDHLCARKACCNPAHLEPVTQAENLRRAFERDGHREFNWKRA